MRSKGIALFWLVTGATGAFNTYVNPIGIDAFAWKYYFFYVGWIIVQFVVVYFFFIEVSWSLSRIRYRRGEVFLLISIDKRTES